MENYAFMVHSFFESTGILVNRKIISFDVVNDLVGGVIQVTWKKLELWIREWRESRNPVAGEWFEWLKVEIEKTSKLPELKDVAQAKKREPRYKRRILNIAAAKYSVGKFLLPYQSNLQSHWQ